jgi:hypothetical protein
VAALVKAGIVPEYDFFETAFGRAPDAYGHLIILSWRPRGASMQVVNIVPDFEDYRAACEAHGDSVEWSCQFNGPDGTFVWSPSDFAPEELRALLAV